MTTSAATLSCVGEPISWLRLELFAAGTPDAGVDAHVAECAACRHCLDQLRSDTVALPALTLPASVKKAQRAWWKTAAPILAVAAAAALVVVVTRRPTGPSVVREDMATVKGVGEVVVSTVRERAGTISDDVRTFAPGDRWKLVLSCPPAGEVHTEVTITEIGGGSAVDRPLRPATIACGNRVVLPGAFTLTGARPNHVCVAFDATTRACVTITPE